MKKGNIGLIGVEELKNVKGMMMRNSFLKKGGVNFVRDIWSGMGDQVGIKV